MTKPHERRCWECGGVSKHISDVTPGVCCPKCGSQDTRRIREKKVISCPEPIQSDEPECPHCHLVHEMPEGDYAKINCGCGWRFIAERKSVIVSSPMEHRE